MVVDVAVSAQLQQWTFQKPSVAVRPERSDSSASSPDLYNNDSETLRIDTAAVDDSTNLDSQDALSLQDRYLSSEEDLSPMEGNSDIESDYGDDVSIHDDSNKENCFAARKMSISRFENGKSCDRAVLVSYVSAGRPKMINLANQGSPVRETPQRSTSLVQLPTATIEKLRKAQEASRLSLAVSPIPSRSISPATSSIESRRPSTGHLPFSHNSSSLQISDSSSFTNGSSRSSTPSIVEPAVRPVSAMPTLQPRASLYISSTAKSRATPNTAFPPLTPKSPEPHSFLSSDPYENSTVNAASPIIKSAPHKRLRSISQKLSLAKIAITPSAKKWDSRVNGRPVMPPTPSTPYTPVTPQTAPPTGSFASPKNRLRRNSRISRPASLRGPSPELPPMTFQTESSPKKNIGRMVARGANEREPMLELPPFPPQETNDPAASIKSRRIRKRKSLMDLL